MFVTNGRSKKEGRGKKEEGLNIEKNGKNIEITISNQLEQLFLSISDQYSVSEWDVEIKCYEKVNRE